MNVMTKLPEDVLKKYQQAGRIARDVRESMKRTICEGIRVIDICEKAEGLIRQGGGQPAFPCNVSVNEVAAHYTSPPEDQQQIPAKGLVKIDLRVSIDGYIADTAVTVPLNLEHDGLVGTAEAALEKAVEVLRPGLFTSRFGSMIERVVKTRGYKPISNLTGHLIQRYALHAGKSLPNVFHLSTSRVSLGEVYGVEPFVTLPDAAGRVRNSSEAYIFRFVKRKSLKGTYAKPLLDYIEKHHITLPFAKRWLTGCVPPNYFETAFSELLSSKSVMAYPVFVEASGRPVAQAEHTVLIVEDGCQVLT